jgi:hypothetical protein
VEALVAGGRFKPTLVPDYARSDFHFINDNAVAANGQGRTYIFLLSFRAIGAEMLEWSGAIKKLIFGSGMGFAFFDRC